MPEEQPREPMPSSLRPAWVYLGLMVALTALIGLASAIIALLVNQWG